MTSLPLVPARFATPRTPSRRSSGRAVGRVAAAVGLPPSPWQRQVLDTATERLPDGTWAYDQIVVSVPRQAGKTTLIGPLAAHRALIRPGCKVWLTAQSRQDARDILVEDFAGAWRRSPLAELARLRRSQGSEGLHFVTGSTFRVFAPNEDALHGKANELVGVDEVWAFTAEEGDALENAIIPTMTTTGGQVLLTSTMGHSGSGWLNRLVREGRAGAPGVAYFEWSLDDDTAARVESLLHAGNLEPAVDLTMAHHPARGHVLPNGQPQLRRGPFLRAAGKSVAGFLRAYGNVSTGAADTLVPSDRWALCLAPTWPEPTGPVALALEAEPDRSRAYVLAVWRDEQGHPRVDVVASTAGVDAAAAELARVRRERSDVVVTAVDAGGPAAAAADSAATHHGLEDLRRLTTADYTVACGQTLASIVAGDLRHRGHPDLDAAAKEAGPRKVGDRWVWDRWAGRVAPLAGASVALWALDHRAEQPAPTAGQMRAA